MITADSLAELLATLVNVPSVTGQEEALAALIAQRLGAVKRGEILRSGRSVVWRGPTAGRPLVVLAGHLDTVPPNGNAVARREGDKLFGLGTTDMKAGDAVMLALVETLDPARLRFDLAVVFYDGEEGPAAGNSLGRLLGEMPWLRDAALAILLEPTSNQVEVGCNGVLNAEVRVPGVAAHSARPWLGANAVERAADWLARITRFETTPHVVHGATYRETLQVTTLKAGRARNVVPDELVANLNYRFPPSMSVGEAERKVRALVPAEFGFEVVDRAEPGLVSLDHPEVAGFVKRFGAKVEAKQGWTDVARFTSAGIPAFNFGPGIPELCHQAGEYCEVPALERSYRWLAEFLSS
ncbi:MAG: succinyl-diaminopimelate desuccinylase [Candidatus Eisenbacteria bacterium]|uniref:Succinyl-diaminopimelate desuccinylase n=1 Tax=Eiseniibacteriota bacterium TaxID=2212470 RepID=A0A849SVQ5_UNCEI|nr:succinyl-diaminopimelate desuccinylase [Candidatus Eisenbacteria bacterium]